LKPALRVLDVDSTLEGERIGMTIDQGALAHIMSVLTDLYSDPEMAVVREYSTNARDSHVEAGRADRPIEVTLPSPLSPFLRIRDYGTGLDADGIRDIYSRYGASTKRDSNDVVGVLGLGCKSALTYADQFTLSGIVGGLRTEVAISRDERGAGAMTIVASYETEDEDGVEVVIPARTGNSFAEKAAELFRFWDEGTVLVNGSVPERIKGLRVADDILVVNQDDVESDVTVVMGGVPYPVPGQYRAGNQHVVFFVGIGEVSFTPSREALQMTPATRATMEALYARETAEKDSTLRRMVADAPTAAEAVRSAQLAWAMGLSDLPTWGGHEIPKVFEAEPVVEPLSDLDGKPKLDEAGNVLTRERRRNLITAMYPKRFNHRGFENGTHSVPAGADAVWLVGYQPDAFTPYKRKKLDQWVSKQTWDGGPPRLFVITDVLPTKAAPWIDPANVVAWESVDAEKIAKDSTTRADGTPAESKVGKYDVWTPDGLRRNMPASEIPHKDLYWLQGATSQWGIAEPPALDLLREAHPDAHVAVLAGNRTARFLKLFPGALAHHQGVRDLVAKEAARLTDADRDALALDYRDRRVLATLDQGKVDDPELAAAIVGAKRHAQLEQRVDRLRRYGASIDLGDRVSYSAAEHYPLLAGVNHYQRPHAHVYLYINAAYAARKEQ
jgi:hypothetical protein